MRFRSTKPWLVVLILGLTAPAILPAHAQNRDYNRGLNAAPAPPRVEFRRQPRWMGVPGTNVLMVRTQDRPAYDLFKVGSAYYIYDNGYWYRANRWRGAFTAIDQRSVPVAFNNVPRQYWRSYPAGWANQHDNGRHNGQDKRNKNGGYRN